MKLDKSKLTFALQPTLGEADGKKTFKGTAYTGDVIPGHWWWGNVVFDLASLQYKSPLGALYDHNPDQRVGVATTCNVDLEQGFSVEGHFMQNDLADTIHKELTVDGYPWEMSVYIKPAKILQYTAPVVVNGREQVASVDAPLTVFYGGRIREVSFTPLGADGGTSVEGFKDAQDSPNGVDIDVEQVGNMTQATPNTATPDAAEIAALQASLAQFKQQAEDNAAALLAFKQQKHDADVTALATRFSVTDAEMLAGFKSMTPEQLVQVTKFAEAVQASSKTATPDVNKTDNVLLRDLVFGDKPDNKANQQTDRDLLRAAM